LAFPSKILLQITRMDPACIENSKYINSLALAMSNLHDDQKCNNGKYKKCH